MVAVLVSISSAVAGLFVSDKRPAVVNETMSMQELAAVQPPFQTPETATMPSFPAKQHERRRDSQEMLEFQATSLAQ